MNSLVSARNLSRHTIESLLQTAQNFGTSGRVKRRHGTIVNLFFEASTRTDLSFQMAAQNLGLKVLDFAVAHSSVNKGESLIDTLQTVDALGVDLAVVRQAGDWPTMLAGIPLELGLVNAGSGVYEHPTQALLDALTIRQSFRSFQNLKITIVGDINHSRVARSNYHLLTTLGAQVRFAGPEHFRAPDLKTVPWLDLDDAISNTDVLMLLRVQHERHTKSYNVAAYHNRYGLTEERLKALKEDSIIMHPGPVNRGVEICDLALEDSRSRILQQVKNGVAVRMAVLDWCLQGGRRGKLVSA